MTTPPPDAAGAGAAHTTATEADARTATGPEKSGPRKYILKPAKTGTLPKAVEKKLVRALKLKAKAGAMFGEAEAAIVEIMSLRTGRERRPVVTPGLVYLFSGPQVIDNKEKNSIQIRDNFDAPSLVKSCVFNKWGITTWKGDGPVKDKETRAAEKAAAKEADDDQLP